MSYSSAMTRLRQLSKKIALGVLIYKLYYLPKSTVSRWLQRGVKNTLQDLQAQKQMERTVTQLVPIRPSHVEPYEIHFLSGQRFWYQTCFCAYSFAQQTLLPIRPIIYDDGTLEQQHHTIIQTIFPNARVIPREQIENQLDEFLPYRRFPYLRERRLNYPNLRKLTDIHAGSYGWKLVLDSDMLFFKSPQLLIDWLQSPQQPCHMVDIETCYGYPQSLMASLANAEIAERINVGICGLKSEDIDWEKLEYWCKTMVEQCGTHYYQEQAIVAMLMAGKPCVAAPEKDYIVMPRQSEVMQPEAVMHHYVADSKPWYFRYGWKHVLQANDALEVNGSAV